VEELLTESQRHNALLDLLNQKRSVTVTHVIDLFGISAATARRDINKLEGDGKLRKVRNGAEATDKKRTFWSVSNIHETRNHDEKTRIANHAASLCSSGHSVVINGGSTAFLLGQELCGRNVQVITNYFPLMSYLIEQDHDGLVIMGGQYHKDLGMTLAPQLDAAPFYAGHYMFTSGKGLTTEGLYKMDMLTAMAEQKMLDHASKLVALVDSSKLGQRAGMLFAPVDRLDMVITGKAADPHVVAQLTALGIEVILV
jgi:DeoR family ulaG and ulaABCDEF operon transcriptional repressor